MISGAISILPEPELEFRYKQYTYDPHAGLALFGPYDTDATSHPGGITYGLIGTPGAIDKFKLFAGAIAGPVVSQAYGNPDVLSKSHLLWPPFPGFETTFASTWKDEPAWEWHLNPEELLPPLNRMILIFVHTPLRTCTLMQFGSRQTETKLLVLSSALYLKKCGRIVGLSLLLWMVKGIAPLLGNVQFVAGKQTSSVRISRRHTRCLLTSADSLRRAQWSSGFQFSSFENQH